MIDFKTYDEQIGILKSRNLIVDDEVFAKNILCKLNYYNIVNAYKDVFVIKGVTPEKYTSGSSFSELYAIHEFDKQLREIVFSNTLLVERYLKSIIAYEFSKRHPHNGYLDINNYNTSATVHTWKRVITASQMISSLNKTLLYEKDNKCNPMLVHYYAKYNEIPLWVFVNVINFGQLSTMFQIMKDTDKMSICKSIAKITGNKVFPDEIQNAIKILVLLRNICAHDQRVFDFDCAPLNVSTTNLFLNKHNILLPSHDFFGAISCISLFFDIAQFDNFITKIKSILSTLSNHIHSVTTQTILTKMGIPNSL